MSASDVTFADIQRAITDRDPQLPDLVVDYMNQKDPPEDRAEGAESSTRVNLGEDAWTLRRFRQSTTGYALWGKDDREKWSIRKQAWQNLMGAQFPPPRLRLADELVAMYDEGDELGRTYLIEIFKRARLGLGVWGAFKRIYKKTEDNHDARMWGALAWRLDAIYSTQWKEIDRGTFVYMRRRAWRYLRELGAAMPDLYVQFAVSCLLHYPANSNFWSSWIANQIWGHGQLIGDGQTYFAEPPDNLEMRAYPEAWKASADPLLRLLEDSPNGVICGWAIRCLQAEFPETLREVDSAWLARLGQKRGKAVHEFIVGLLNDTPEFHQSKLAGLGLVPLVVSMLDSESKKARKYALDYANSHIKQLDPQRLAELAACSYDDAAAFAKAKFEKMDAKAIGLPVLITLLGNWRTNKLGKAKLEEGFGPDDLDAEGYIEMYMRGGYEGRRMLTSIYNKAKKRPPAGHIKALLADSRLRPWDADAVLRELGKLPVREIGLEWIKESLLDPRYRSAISGWLRGGKLKGADLDVEWVKGLVMRPALRATAISVLSDTKLVPPAEVGVGWLLVMARQADPSLNSFAQNHLLMHFAPSDFASAERSGIDRLFELVGDLDEPESVREFASLYLRLNHPELGTSLPEARQLGTKPRLPREAYSQDRIEPLFLSPRAEVRRFAQTVGRHELGRWDDPPLVYRLARSRYREPRVLAGEVLLDVGQEGSERALDPARWLDGAEVFSLAESSEKGTREVALTLIRRHYASIGGARKLAWLMESPDREVRLAAVRMLWDKHRPSASDGESERFETHDALVQFLRDVMFGLPPGRMERRDSSEALPDRALSASEAKRRLVDMIRDFAVEDAEFAKWVVPVLEDFMHSQAQGEWHACVAALAQVRRAHGDAVAVALPPAKTPLLAPRHAAQEEAS